MKFLDAQIQKNIQKFHKIQKFRNFLNKNYPSPVKKQALCLMNYDCRNQIVNPFKCNQKRVGEFITQKLMSQVKSTVST